MDDAKIVDLFLKRDEAAIAEASLKYGERLRKLAFKLVHDIPAAEECENDTYFKAWNLIPPHEPKDHLFAFLASITRGVAISRFRADTSLKRSAALVELTRELETCLPSGASVESEAEANELGRLIDRFINTEPTEKRMLFVRRYWYCDTVEELAERFGCSRARVKTELFRMRGRLADFLRKEGYHI